MGEGLLELLRDRALRRCRSAGIGTQVRGALWVHGGGDVVVGEGVVFDGVPVAVELIAHPGATIVLGERCVLEGGCSIEATTSIQVGALCRLGAFSKVMDNHFHPIDGDRRVRPQGNPVVLEDGVWLGPHATVLAGVRIGRGSRVGAAAVIKCSLPACLYVRGSPPAAVRDARLS